MRVGVLGAGFAGLAAAYELANRGHEVVVLEARRRLGGRVYSDRLGKSVIERGGEFVLDGYEVMRSLAGRFGLSFYDTEMSYYARQPRDDRGANTSLDELCQRAPLIERLAADAGARSVSEALASSGLDEPLRRAVAARCSISAAWPAEDLAPEALSEAASRIDDAPTHRLAGGNQLLAEALASAVRQRGGVISLDEQVVSVSYGEPSRRQGCRLLTARGVVELDAAVVTAPLAVTKRLDFDPPLPSSKLEALSHSAAGQAAKLHVPVREPAALPPSAVMSVPDRYWCWTAADEEGVVAPLLSCFAGSQPALDALDLAAGPERWLERLAWLRPELRLDGARAVLTTWKDDPWSQMAYSCHRSGRSPDPDALAAPLGPLHFAGEHTASGWTGLMEGALRSGLRAAAEINAG